MEESFRVRIDKAFASISSSSSVLPSSSSSSTWSLTVDEIQPKDLKPEPQQDQQKNIDNDLQDFDDVIEDQDEEEVKVKDEERKQIQKPEDYNDEEWVIKSSIGLDSTLDYEEEEDAYDKVAVGKDKVRDEDRLYMKDVNDYDIDADLQDELPFSFKDHIKDPRANHTAAKTRLKEDADAANKINSLQVSETAPAAAVDSTGEDDNLKSILKRKDDKPEPKENQSKKRVRFDAECKPPADEESEGMPTEENSMEEDVIPPDDSYKLPPDYPSGIPDYMRNPSNYKRYTFESSDVDDASNQQAFMDFHKMTEKPNATESGSIVVELPKSVLFVPKKKTSESMVVESQSKDDAYTLRGNLRVSISDDEVCEMEEDEPESITDSRNSLQKSSRQYRVKTTLEPDDDES